LLEGALSPYESEGRTFESFRARHFFSGRNFTRALCPAAVFHRAVAARWRHLAASNAEPLMTFELFAGALVALIVLVYLLAALARPERF
jgi:hypothetical protein